MPKYNNPRKTWEYSQDFKAKAVELTLLEGVRVKDVAATLDIHPMMLSRWRKHYREGSIVSNKRKKVTSLNKEKKELTELNKLKKENERLQKELDILKNGNGLSRRNTRQVSIYREIRSTTRREIFM